MQQIMWTPEPLPEYHEELLLVKLRPEAAAPLAAAAGAAGLLRVVGIGISAEILSSVTAAGPSLITAASPGLQQLDLLARAGRIKRAVSLYPSAASLERTAVAAPGMLASMAITAAAPATPGAAAPDPSGILAGTTLLELSSKEDVRDIQVTLSADHSIEFVDQVPVRYLAFAGG